MAYGSAPGKESEAKSAHMETQHLSRAMKDAPHGYVQAAELALSYRLPLVAQQAINMTKKIRAFPREPLIVSEVRGTAMAVWQRALARTCVFLCRFARC